MCYLSWMLMLFGIDLAQIRLAYRGHFAEAPGRTSFGTDHIEHIALPIGSLELSDGAGYKFWAKPEQDDDLDC